MHDDKDDDDLHDRFGDILKEVPEAEEALRQWRDRQRAAARRKILDAFWAQRRAMARCQSNR
jgi:hypothetical protein